MDYFETDGKKECEDILINYELVHFEKLYKRAKKEFDELP